MSLFLIAAGGVTAALVGFVVKAGADQRSSGHAQEQAWQAWQATGQPQPGWDPRFAWAAAEPVVPAGRAVSVRPVVVVTARVHDDVVDAELVEPLALPTGPGVTR